MNSPSPTIDSRRRRWFLRASGLGVALATLALMLATEPRLAIVWDEGYTLGRENRVRLWFRALRDPAAFARTWIPLGLELVQVDARMPPPPRPDQIDTRAELFDRAVIAWFWPFAREEPHGHPPFYALVGLIGDVVVPDLPELERARVGPILVFSLTAGCLFGFMARRWGPWAGAAAAGAWALQPQLFGHGHYAAYDALLTCLWVDAILAFWLAVEEGRPRWGWAVAFGVLLGWAADTKLTGWFLAVPFVGWAALYGIAGAFVRSTPHPNPPPQGGREPDPAGGKSSPSPLAGEGRVGGERANAALRVALVGAPIALLTLYLFNPAWWLDPVGGVER
ncbi:MAG TPA: glycosyltransferase family 39 protein, partial [Isosphaeraceae bacterium]